MYKQSIFCSALKAGWRFFSNVLLVGTILSLGSCSTVKDTFYFKTLQKDTTITGLVNKELESRIVKGDNLSIAISSLSKEEDIVFNMGTTNQGTVSPAGFLVDQDGTVTIHKIGKVQAEGLSRKELAATLQKQLLIFLKDPIVTVQYLNHKITVVGEVIKPQVINMPEEQLSLIDVLVISGDLNENARRNDIMIIREKGNEKKVKHINLEDHSIFTSPWYYVQPNDIVVVSPDLEKKERQAKRLRFQSNFSLIISTVSLVLIIVDRIFR
ncbi:MAG: polysaccharide biosynthesis/export family protein [Ferruginibacter sp.]